MIKKIRLYASLTILSIILFSCGGSNEFTVSGNMDGWANDSIVVQELLNNALQPINTIYLDEKGQFEFSDTASNPRFLFIQTSDGKFISLLLMNGQKVSLSVSKEDFEGSYKVTGSKESQLVWELNSEMRKASMELDSLSKIYQSRQASEAGPELDSLIQGQYQDLKAQQKTFITQFIDKHYESPAALLALSHQLGNESILSPQLDFDYFLKVDEALSEKYPGSSLVSTLHKFVEGVKYQKKMAANSNQSIPISSEAPGISAEAPDITMLTPEGKTIKLSDYRGKHVLLDFWAAWCGPCRRENPNLVKAYANFKDKGFEIFQVSLDRAHDDWTEAIKADALNWVHVSDLKYWDSEGAKLYAVKSIPASFLIDPDGKIIAKNLRGPALEEKLNEILN